MIRRFPLLILGTFCLFALFYSITVPMFEAPDESEHFGMVQRFTQTFELPVQNAKEKTPWGQEGSQPPLYYALASLVARLVPAPVEPYPLQLNPHAEIGMGLARLNRNVFVHTAKEAFPWQGIALRFQVTRWFSILLGALTVLAVHRAVRLALPTQPETGLIAMAFVAFMPQFLFVSASVNNDNLVTTLSAGAMWIMMVWLRRGLNTRRALYLAGVLALASLSKLSGLTLYPVAAVMLVALLFKRRISFWRFLSTAFIIAAGFVLIAGWWYLRNWILYDDPTGLSAMISLVGPRQEPYTILTMLNEMQGLRISFWALFGWFNVIGPQWFLTLMDLATGISLVMGVLYLAYKIRMGRFEAILPLGIFGLHFLIVFASLINWTRMTPGTQGRLLFPALVSIAGLMALGGRATAIMFHVVVHEFLEKGLRLVARVNPYIILSTVGPRGLDDFLYSLVPLRWWALVALPIVMAVEALLAPLASIAPAYAPPPMTTQVPANATKSLVRFGKIDLVGFRIPPDPVLPGGLLPITIYYRGEPNPRNLSMYFSVLDPQGNVVGKLDTYPGGGNWPTENWTPNIIYADSYLIPISDKAEGPFQFRIEYGWWNFLGKDRVAARDAEGKPLEAVFLKGGALLASAPPTPPAVAQSAIFSGALRLNGYSMRPPNGAVKVGEPLEITLYWEGLTRVYEDFAVFVHVVGPDGKPIAQGDGQPRNSSYPTTSWIPLKPLTDTHTLMINTAGTYQVKVGLYRPRDNSRLPVNTGGDALTLQTQIIVRP